MLRTSAASNGAFSGASNGKKCLKMKSAQLDGACGAIWAPGFPLAAEMGWFERGLTAHTFLAAIAAIRSTISSIVLCI
jgi:hypothetical protein